MLENHDNQPQKESHGIPKPFPCSRHAMCLLLVFFPGNSQFYEEDTLFFEPDHATMSGCFSIWIMWIGNCRDVLRSVETFQSLAPFSSFIFEFFCFLTGHSPSLWNWIMGSLAVTGCWFAATHCALNNSITTSNTLLCRHVYIWSNCGHADSMWHKVPDHFYTKNTSPNWYIPIILGWAHLVRDHM